MYQRNDGDIYPTYILKQPMRIWLITDTHFGHDKMIPYCGRPEGFENLILENLHELLEPNDLLIHLGDFCIGNDSGWHADFMETVPCKKWLIRGNHDGKSDNWYLEHGWDFVGAKFQSRYFGKNILFSHTPVRYTELQSSLFITDGFDINIHGHFHNSLHRLQEGKFIAEGEKERNKVDLKNITARHKLLAVEYTDYKPVLLEEFIKNFL